jgi:hypothetical protein
MRNLLGCMCCCPLLACGAQESAPPVADASSGVVVELCGNGIVDEGEKGDPGIASAPSACPASCDDGDGCTQDTLIGESCEAECKHELFEQCKDNDDCCPKGCNANDDSDCHSACGNGVVEDGETCDSAIASGPSSCPASCNDGNVCTADVLEGSACQAKCSYSQITACIGGDQCCPQDCTSVDDSDCSATYGNGVVEGIETCDTAIAQAAEGACPSSCDDSNTCKDDHLSGSGCNVVCTHSPIPYICFRLTEYVL